MGRRPVCEEMGPGTAPFHISLNKCTMGAFNKVVHARKHVDRGTTPLKLLIWVAIGFGIGLSLGYVVIGESALRVNCTNSNLVPKKSLETVAVDPTD